MMPIKTTKVSMSEADMNGVLLSYLKIKITDPILNITMLNPSKIYVETEKPAKDVYSRKVYRKFTIEISKGWL